jgi:hypothetical protein
MLLSALAVAGCRGANSPRPGEAALTQFLAAIRERAQAAEAIQSRVVLGHEGWLFFAPELRHLSVGPFWGDAASRASQAARPDAADPLPAIVDFRDQLAARGIELLLVPVPPKSVVYPDKLVGAIPVDARGRPPRLDPQLQTFYALLRQRGLEVLDLTDSFLAARTEGADPLYCRRDTHWSGRGIVLAAEAMARRLHQRPWARPSAPLRLTARWATVSIEGDLQQMLGAPGREGEAVRLRFVGTPQGGDLVPIAPDPASPVILLGDSHALVFHAGDDMHARGAGLADQLALELGFAVDLVAVRGSGATAARLNLIRRAQRDPAYWTKKKLVIWCFGAREFTEGDGWRVLPLPD